MCPKIKETLRRGISEEIIIKTFVMDPKDRRNIEYWDDKKFVEWFEHGHEEAQPKKKGKIKKGLKGEKPLVRLLPLIDALRNNRYLQIKELYVWGVYLEYSDMLCLKVNAANLHIWKGSMVAKGSYELSYIELIDCFINQKAIDAFAPNVNYTKTLRDLILDFNEFGDSGCYTLCEGLKSCRWLVRLSVCFCGLNKQSGIWLGNLVAETSIRELFLDGNNLEAEGATALLTQLAEAAYLEGKERERLKAERMAVAVAQAQTGRKRIDLDAPLAESETHTAEDPSTVSDVNPESVSVNAYIQKNEANTNVSASRKRQTLGKGKNKRKSAKMPPCGPQITHLHMAENSINSIGRGGSFAPARCMQLLKTQDLQEIDIFGNDIGQVAGRIVLEGILARKDNNLPRVGLRVTHLINQDTYDMIRKLAPKPKGKKR
uniref:Uncharacterized protein n=1 Tax=Echinococcus canadensis TaxID=519352 RepID=A0A915EVJ5_9CEST